MTDTKSATEKREEFDTLFDVKYEHEGVCMTFSSKNPSREDIFKWILKNCVFKEGNEDEKISLKEIIQKLEDNKLYDVKTTLLNYERLQIVVIENGDKIMDVKYDLEYPFSSQYSPIKNQIKDLLKSSQAPTSSQSSE